MKTNRDWRLILSTLRTLALDVGTASARPLGGRLFRKEVLRAGRWIHPSDDSPIEFSVADLHAIAAETNRYIAALGGRLRFPDGHDAVSARAANNLGYWLSFAVEEDRLIGVVEAADDEVARMLGGRIRDVSVYLEREAKDAHGNRFHHVLTHVAATPEPVIEGQTNFVALSREGTNERVPVFRLAARNGGQVMHERLAKVAAVLGVKTDGLDEEALLAALEARSKEVAASIASASEAQALATKSEAAALAAKTEASALATRVTALEKDIEARDRLECDREVGEVKALCARQGKPEALDATREKFVRDRWGKDREAARQTLALARELAGTAPGTPAGTGGTVVVKPVDKEAKALAKADAIETARREARALGWSTREESGRLLATRPGETREIVLVG
jgi:hypothetical protein